MFLIEPVFVFQNLTGDGSVRLLVLPIIHTNTLEVLSALITAWVVTYTHCLVFKFLDIIWSSWMILRIQVQNFAAEMLCLMVV